jgi:osmotically-inducible protein OsmY
MLSVSLAVLVSAMCPLSTPLAASEGDDRIVQTFENSYVYKTYLADDAIITRATNGVVRLTGTVEEEAHKYLAQETASGLPGVVTVENQITSTGGSSAVHSDAWLIGRVHMTLLFHRHVSSGTTTVTANDGVVTLAGEVSSLAQKELTIAYVKDIDGVREVKDAMTVRSAPAVVERTGAERMDDASITAQVRLALMNHRSTSAAKTVVQTSKGEVVITGIARNDAERSLVSKLVGDIQGVTEVKNQMTVAEPGSK